MAARKNKGLELENGPFQASLSQAANRIFLLGKSSNAPSTEILGNGGKGKEARQFRTEA
jgi:hypothetical protein